MDSTGFFHNPSHEDEEGDLYSDTFRPPRRYFPDTYLDSPILTHQRVRWSAALVDDELLKGKTQFARTVKEAKDRGANTYDFPLLDPDGYPDMYHHAWPSTISTEWKEAKEIAVSIYVSVQRALTAKLKIKCPPLSTLSHPKIEYWLSRWSYWDSLVEEYSKQSALQGGNVTTVILGKHTRLIASKDIWFVACKPIGSFMLTYEQVLMLKDLMYSRAQSFIAASLFYNDSVSLTLAVEQTCEWHEKCLRRYGNPGFEILSKTEALSKAYMSEMTDPIFTKDGPYPRMIEKIRAKERALGATTHFLCEEFDQVLRQLPKIDHVVEIFGLLKISGHPLIDPSRGGRSSAKEARDPDQTLYTDGQSLDWEFKRCMLMSYVRRYGSWPTLDFTPAGKRTKLYRRYRRQFRGLNRKSYPLEDWQHCRFNKIVDFDYAPNYLDFLDDKAISLYRTNVAAFWDADVKPQSHRRLLLELINREELSIRQIVNLVVRREIPIDWLIVSVHPKEREFKLDPRMFSMLVLEIRIFFALTESNLADQIFPFLPQQTMTMNKVQIAKKFLEITRPLSSTDALRLFIEVDLSRWNLRWRDSGVGPVGRTLNDMFGVVGIFDYCHTFFSSSMVVVRVSDLRPDGIEKPNPPETDLVWYNHLGGFEGICQKLWTICTYMMVSLAINDLPLGYTLLGQGDNQVVSIVTSRKSNMTDQEVLIELRDQVVNRVSRQCSKVNQEVKPEECLESTTVITYSKDVYVKGVYYPTTLKFHSRLFPHSSQIFPSVRTNLGAIFSTAVAGAEKSSQPLLSYFLACLYGSLYLTRTMMGRGPFGRQLQGYKAALKDRTPDFIRFMLTLPSEAGGFPVVPFIGFTYKGGSDPLGKSLSAMVSLGLDADNRLYNRMLAQMDQDSIYNPEPNLSSLFMDPFSIPIKKPVTSTDGVAVETMAALRPKIRTHDLEQLMSASTATYLERLVKCLQDCAPLNPLIMRDILDCSVAGVTDTIGKMFVATRTLQHVVRAMGIPVVDKVLHLESSGLLYMLNRFKNLPSDPAKTTTIFALTTRCRNRWHPGKESPIVGLTTYQPLDFKIVLGREGLSQEGVNAVLVSSSDPLNTRGPFDPYVGSRTREKRSEHGFRIIGTDSASRAMRKLQLIASQSGGDDMFTTILDVVGWSRTNTKLSEVSHLLPGTSGGTLSHRYAARAGHQDAYNIGSPNFATHCVVSTDNTGKLSGGMFDYPAMFQEYVLFCLWVLLTVYMSDPTQFNVVTLVTEDVEMDPLPNVVIKGPDTVELPVLRYPDNPLVFIPGLKLEHVSGAIQHPALPMTDDFTPSTHLRRVVIEAFFRDILRKHSMGRQIADGATQHFQGHTLDLAEVKSNGLWLIAKCISNVIVDEAISNFMMTDLNQMTRWVVQTYAMKLISPLASAVTPLLGHPLLVQDSAVVRFDLYDKPAYGGGSYSGHNRYCGIIQKMINHTLTGNNAEYNHRSVGLFTSDNSRILSETLIQCLLCDMYVWIRSGVLNREELNLAIGSTLLPMIRAQRSESDKVSLVVRASCNVARMISNDHPGASAVALRLGRGRVMGYRTTIQDLLRSTRDTDAWGLPKMVQSTRKIMKFNSSLLPPSDNWSPAVAGEVMSGTRPLDLSRSTPDQILTEVYYRNLSRVGYYSGTAVFTWSVFAGLLAKSPLIVIGSGMGAAARVAIDNGCPHVFGLDLRSSIPMKSHRFRSYKPPLVMGSEYSERYTQMAESYTTSGDWMEGKVQMAALSYDSGDMTLLIDIQAASTRYSLDVLEGVINFKRSGVIILRVYLNRDEHLALCADLSASGVTFRSYTLEATGSVYPVIFVLMNWSDHLVMSLAPSGDLEPRPIPLPFNEDVEPFEVTIARSDSIFNLFMPSNCESLVSIKQGVERLISETKGDYDSRFAYGQWTKLLRALLSTEFMLLDDDKRLGKALQWYFAGEATCMIGDEPFRIKVDWQLCYHLVSTVARIL